MANLKNVIYLSNEDYETLVSTGTVTIDGTTLTYDENNVYITPDKLVTTTEDGLMSCTDKVILDTINGAYIKNASVSNNTLTLTKQDGTTVTYTASSDNQRVKAGSVTFDANDVVNFEGSGIVSVTGDATNDKITISASHQSIKTLKTDNTAAQSTSSSEAIAGSGTINLHKVAKTGTYSDLIGTPTIPTVNNATLTIQKNGSTVKTFTANASTDVTANITVPTTLDDISDGTYRKLANYLPIYSPSFISLAPQGGGQIDTFDIRTSESGGKRFEVGGFAGARFYGGYGGNAYVQVYYDDDSTGLASFSTDLGDGSYYTARLPRLSGEIALDSTVSKYQSTSVIVGNATTNLNGRTFQNYTAIGPTTSGGYTYYQIKKNGNVLTKADAAEYMKYMTGSEFVPTYNYDFPKQTVFTFADRSTWKPQWDSTNGLMLYRLTTSLALASDVNNGTLSIQGNGTTASTFTANQSGNTTLNIKGSGATTVTKSANNEITISSTDNNNNQKVKTSSVTFGADDVVEIKAGSNVTVTGDASAKTITIASSYTDTNYYATSDFTSSNGTKIATGYSSGTASTTYDLYVPNANGTTQAGVVTTGNQTFGGAKTFSSAATFSSGLALGNATVNNSASPTCGDGTTIIQPSGEAVFTIRTTTGQSRDVGLFRLTQDNAYIANSGDNVYVFGVFDTDKTQDFSTLDTASFAVKQNQEGVTMKGTLTVNGYAFTYPTKSGTVALLTDVQGIEILDLR